LPIYEYECIDCGEHVETMQKINDKPLTSCPSCSGKVRKLVSNCSFQLKGTDYAKKSEEKGEKKEEKRDKKSDNKKDKSKSKKTTQDKAVNQ